LAIPVPTDTADSISNTAAVAADACKCSTATGRCWDRWAEHWDRWVARSVHRTLKMAAIAPERTRRTGTDTPDSTAGTLLDRCTGYSKFPIAAAATSKRHQGCWANCRIFFNSLKVS